MKISRIEFFKILINNRGVFGGVSENFDKFIKEIPNGCAGCYYRRVERVLNPLVNQHKQELQNRCFLIFKKDVIIE